MPTPTPTAEQIEAVREIALLYSYAQTETLVEALNDASWAATIADIAEWARVKNKHARIKGDGVEINKDDNRLDITNRVRRRLGLFPSSSSSSAGDSGPGGDYSSYTAPREDQLRFRCFE